uniref:Importin N-terminal domain-containing protein n=2 Tax=Brassica campestris TaxID=3711 RepID=M4FB69_BRACM
METNLQCLLQCLLDTLSPDSELCRAAEALLLDAAGLPDYGLTVLRLVVDSSDDQTRHVASVAFKNHLRSQCLPDGISPVTDSEKEQIKTCIVSLMESSSLSHLEPVAASAHDYASVNGILWTANSICKIFGHKYITDDQLLDLKYCCDTFSEPLINMFRFTDSFFQTTGTSSYTVVNLKIFD